MDVPKQAVILAGGLATRMQPRTLTVPKILLEVRTREGSRPFADLQLEMLAKCNYQRVVVCVAHLGEQVRAYVGDGKRWGLHVEWSDEGKELLGTGGALRIAAPLLDETFLVTYGDSYLPFDYAAPLDSLRAHADCDGVMSVFRNEGKWDPSNVRTDGEWILAYEKGTKDPAFDHIDYGAIALRRETVLGLPERQRSGLDELQARLARMRRLRAWVARERFYEIGSPEGLEALEKRLIEQR